MEVDMAEDRKGSESQKGQPQLQIAALDNCNDQRARSEVSEVVDPKWRVIR